MQTATVAVLTAISEDEVHRLLAAYGLGNLCTLDGLPGGSVNSNFRVTCASEAGERQVFLRLYEERDLAGAGREAAMLRRLAMAGVPTPAPLPRLDGALVSVARGKPAAFLPWCDGGMRCQAAVDVDAARQVGEALARVHLAGRDEECERGRFRFDDLGSRLDRVAESGHPQFAPLVPWLRARLTGAHHARDPQLPSGLVHGDLFRDNVLWHPAGGIAALLDFESACEGTYAYDLMVTTLSWCFGDDLEPRLACAMREGYERVRPLSEAEKRGLHAEAVFAAMRFTITRITDFAMREATPGPRIVKDWKRFMKRFDTLEEVGSEGLRRAVGAMG
ncbi:MAG: homoserine kinase [Myxococcota bacterium]|nr:homoserine kinase [Myxococcota bacterium]